MIINKKGFTLAEALVAMLLVAIMAAGVIVALMSTKRAIVAPTNREEMLFAKSYANFSVSPALCDMYFKTLSSLTIIYKENYSTQTKKNQ